MPEYLIHSIIFICLFPLILMLTNALLDYQKIKCDKENMPKPDDKSISGFRRATIALTFIIIIGIALFHLVAGEKIKSVPGELIGNIISTLTGVVASIAGFYFGGKAALGSSNENKPQSNEPQQKEPGPDSIETINKPITT